ncbi:unspecified product [Leishmania tarentolae]|uniref:Unspecified product n=1 Tax=Leishmania tarentolae TaxID=5689 RepID=A0A640KT31_LEITA|nr:unspecified product [Leishmania tarentolae]
MRKLVTPTAMTIFASEMTMTRSPVHANKSVNAVILITALGVSLVLGALCALWKLFPRIRDGELSENIGFQRRGGLAIRKSKRGKVLTEDDVSSADMI